MKRLALISATTLCAALVCLAAARAATTYNNAVRAIQSAPTEGEGVAFLVEAEGDLPGMGRVTLRRDGNNVTGGTWSLTVLPAGADASASEKGRLSGAVTGGSFSFRPDGTVAGVSSVQLTVEEGTGQHAAVSGGGGTLNLSADAENPSKLRGSLVLDF